MSKDCYFKILPIFTMNRRTYCLIFLVGLLFPALLAHSTRPANAKRTSTTGCCGIQSVTWAYGQKQLFIPNVFTPNGDGFNDYFLPFINDRSLLVRDFTILTAQGNSVLFNKPSIDYSTLLSKAQYGWNGRRKDGTCYQGLFKYRLQVETVAGTLESVEGTACSMLCPPKGQIVRTKEGCLIANKAITD